MDYFDGVHVFGTSSSMGPLDYKELFICLAFSTTPASDRYVMHVSVDMTACPWKLNYDDHQVSTIATHDSNDVARTHDTTRPPTCASPLLVPPRLFFMTVTCGPAEMRQASRFHTDTRFPGRCSNP